MTKGIVKNLTGDKTTVEYKVWSKWIKSAAILIDRYLTEVIRHTSQEDVNDPFSYNETASVSMLAGAAAHAGYVGLAEFSATKIKLGVEGNGRYDFWMLGKGRSWAFEFKQWTPITAPSGRLTSYMDKAIECAKEVHSNEADVAVAGLIVPFGYVGHNKTKEEAEIVRDRARINLIEFAENQCDFSWVVVNATTGTETYFLFNIVSP